ncbi:MAG: methylated-DNA-[protein]-cysteine S-methyltransferase [Solirubrobacterales bacterium]|jgi:methylated-DNA-[protein]-cysteine S-methyltransferase|nr:methylated-DNA-[protein]-cysteine S-methyltransferase [Solirubrobacterales bacterium]
MSRVDAKTIAEALGGGLDDDADGMVERLAARADREGLVDVAYASFDSPLGTGYVAATERGILSLSLPTFGAESFLEHLTEVSPRVLELPGRLDEARRELDQYFEGRRHDFDLDLDWRLVRSKFASRVLHETARVPYGVTTSYGEVAARAGNPRAFRAAGTALGHNPMPIVVPCHRVLRAGGVLGSYGGGPEMKAFLLRLEGALE